MDLNLKVPIQIKCWNDTCTGQEYQDSGNRTLQGQKIYQCINCKSQIIISQ